MKKKFVIAISLLCIAVVSSVAAFAFGLQEKTVEQKQETLFGDASFTDGITIEYPLTSVMHANWYLRYDFGAGSTGEKASFSATEDFKYKSVGNISDAVFKAKYTYSDEDDISNNRYIGVYRGFDALEFEERFRKEFEVELPVGSEGRITKQYFLKDLQEYYRPSTSIGGNYFSTHSANRNLFSGELSFWNKFYDYFKIPVLEDDIIEVEVSRLKSNNSIAVWVHSLTGSDTVTPDSYGFYSKSILADDALYFTFSNITDNGKYVDFSLVPGGYGIYKMPYDKEKDTSAQYQEGVLDINNLQTIFALKENEQVGNMGLSSDGSHLYIIISDNLEFGSNLTFKSINLKTFAVDQEFLLEEYQDSCYIIQKKNFVVVHTLCTGHVKDDNYNHLKVLYERSPGVYEMLVDARLDNTEALLWKHFTPVCACDGERFVACNYENRFAANTYSSWVDIGTGICLSVYQDNELKYIGKYTNSLDQCNVYNIYSNSETTASPLVRYFTTGENDTYHFNVHAQYNAISITIN